jgi:hypothetical protein
MYFCPPSHFSFSCLKSAFGLVFSLLSKLSRFAEWMALLFGRKRSEERCAKAAKFAGWSKGISAGRIFRSKWANGSIGAFCGRVALGVYFYEMTRMALT